MLSASPWVAVFGLLGIFLRWSIQLAVSRELPGMVAWATLSINALGSFLIGVVMVASQEAMALSEPMRLGLTVGFLGGFTTFSAFSMESWSFFNQGDWWRGVLYFLGSPALGLLSAGLGIAAARLLLPTA